MPIYEYRCSSCGHELESLQKFSDAPLAACPSCHADTFVKKVSAAGFQLKGSGWYATDFKQSGAKPAAAKPDGAGAAEGAGASDAAAKGDSKGDSQGRFQGRARGGDEERGQGLGERCRAGRQDRSHSCRLRSSSPL